MNGLPTLVVVSGPPGAGKTTLAHLLARAVGCPAICRDPIKEGMVHATPGFTPAITDELSLRTLPAFFGVLELLLRSGVTTVAEAAFQDRLWRPGLEPLLGLAHLRIVHCTADGADTLARRRQRWQEDPVRRAHESAPPAGPPASFDRVSVDAPQIEVDTTQGYRPGLDAIVAFINGGHG